MWRGVGTSLMLSYAGWESNNLYFATLGGVHGANNVLGHAYVPGARSLTTTSSKESERAFSLRMLVRRLRLLCVSRGSPQILQRECV